MTKANPKIARTISWIAAIVAVVVALVVPLGYFSLSYQNQVGELDTEAEMSGHLASEIINANPEFWRFQEYKLTEFLSRRPRHGEPESRRILDTENRIIAESGAPLRPPLLTRSAELYDSGVAIGRIEIRRSLLPLLLRTAGVALFSLLLGLGVFAALKILPLRALDQALEDNTRLFEQTQRNLERVRALREIDQSITSTLDLNAVLTVLLQKIDLVLPYAATTVRLFNKQSGLLEPVVCRNLDEKEWKAEQWKGGRGTPNVAFESKAPVTSRNVQADPRVKDPEFFRKHGLVSYLGIPLIVKDEVLGVISFYTKEEHEFSDEEVEFLSTLASQAAVAIHNSQLYQEMVKLAADLSRSNKVKDEFLSVMSHELRTPLNVVVGYTAMIKEGLLGPITPEQENALDKVISRTRDQLAMISSILQVVQVETEGVKAVRGRVALGEFLKDLQSGYAMPLGRELSLVWDYPADLPVVDTDEEKLRHILQNLIDNAIKFTDRGTVTVSARITESSMQKAEGSQQGDQGLPTADRLLPAGGRCVEFRVADTGIGIPKEHLSVIFEKFRQLDSSETRRHGGVGIGLYIAKKFTEMLGGRIEVESEVGKGSTFTVTIPCGFQNAESGTP